MRYLKPVHISDIWHLTCAPLYQGTGFKLCKSTVFQEHQGKILILNFLVDAIILTTGFWVSKVYFHIILIIWYYSNKGWTCDINTKLYLWKSYFVWRYNFEVWCCFVSVVLNDQVSMVDQVSNTVGINYFHDDIQTFDCCTSFLL